jgi:hypothetical protein
MWNKIIPVFIIFLLLQLMIRYLSRRKKSIRDPSRHLGYKKKIDQLLKEGRDYHDSGEGHVAEKHGEIIVAPPGLGADKTGKKIIEIVKALNCAIRKRQGMPAPDDVSCQDPEGMINEMISIVQKHSR